MAMEAASLESLVWVELSWAHRLEYTHRHRLSIQLGLRRQTEPRGRGPMRGVWLC